MRLHLLSAKAVSEDLATNSVGAREQALYTAVAAVTWLLPYYSFVVPPYSSDTSYWFYTMWTYEALMMILLNFAGAFYCLRRCRVRPAQNFLVDLTCLSAPIALTTIIAAWTIYHFVVRGGYELASKLTFAEQPPQWLSLLLSRHFLDLLTYMTTVGILVIYFHRVASHMDDISLKREVANKSLQPSPQIGAAEQ